MTAFLLMKEDEARLKAAADRARAKPISWELLKSHIPPHQETPHLTLADRKGVPPPRREPEQITLPFGWRVAISCEEQPAGILLHVSMSSPAKKRVPRFEAMFMVVEACGFTRKDVARAWLEEFEPGRDALNVLVAVSMNEGGRA